MFEPNYKLEQTNVNLGAVKAVGPCSITNQVYTTKEFSLEDFKDWSNSNKPIQNTGLSSLSDDDREFLISGMSPKAFNELDNN